MTTAKRRRRLERNITTYYVLRILVKRLVWPILTIFLVRNQLSPAEIGTIFAASTIVGLAFEVPSGAIADRIGRRNAMALNFLGSAVSMFLFWVGGSFTTFLIAQVVYQVAGSLWTGTNEAFLYETLHELGRSRDFKAITGRALLYSQLTTGALFIVIPIIAAYALALPFLLNVVVFLAAVGLTATLAEPQRAMSVAAEESGDRFGFLTFLRHRTLLPIGLAFAASAGVGGILEDFRQVYLDAIHVDLVYFGIVYLGLRVLTGTIGSQSHRIERAIGARAMLWCIPFVSLVQYAALAVIDSTLGIAFLILDGIQEGLSRPVEQEYLNRYIDGSKRASMLSIFNLCAGLFRAGAVFAGGFVIDAWGIHAGFTLAVALMVLVVLPLFRYMIRATRMHAARA